MTSAEDRRQSHATEAAPIAESPGKDSGHQTRDSPTGERLRFFGIHLSRSERLSIVFAYYRILLTEAHIGTDIDGPPNKAERRFPCGIGGSGCAVASLLP